MGWRSPPTLNLFEVAPNLRYLTIEGDFLPSLVKAPLEQIHILTFIGLKSMELIAAMSLILRLPHNTKCHLGLDLEHWDDSSTSDSGPTPSDIIALSLENEGYYSSLGIRVLRGIIASLLAGFTLPALHELSVTTKYNSQTPLPWPCDHFLALAERSSFDAHLTSLELYCVLITEEELLKCLAALPSLERLAISDHRRDREEEYEVYGEYEEEYDEDGHYRGDCDLITDTLLAKLTRAPDSPCLVPRLRVFNIHSVLKFDDCIYLAFLRSRVAAETPFESHIWWLYDYRRALHWPVVREIDELCRRKELVFSFELLKG
ncbi:hypothetical protein DFH09DRAFT_1361796 [Mycena vulgaris]|nr:hypothetical protein DFH09DRAFT_1361796 [Mycena vulgaris]